MMTAVQGLFNFFLTVLGPVESDPEYKLIVEANNIMVEIDNEIGECLYDVFPLIRAVHEFGFCFVRPYKVDFQFLRFLISFFFLNFDINISE